MQVINRGKKQLRAQHRTLHNNEGKTLALHCSLSAERSQMREPTPLALAALMLVTVVLVLVLVVLVMVVVVVAVVVVVGVVVVTKSNAIFAISVSALPHRCCCCGNLLVWFKEEQNGFNLLRIAPSGTQIKF